VGRNALGEHTSDTTWDGFRFEGIQADDIVSSTTPLLDVLERLHPERPRLFVLGRRSIEAIVTIYDLNQPAAHHLAFALALVIEAELGGAIERHARYSDDELDTDVDERLASEALRLPAAQYGGAHRRVSTWRRKLRAGEQVRFLQELVFHDKLGLVSQMGLSQELAGRCRSPYDDAEALIRTLNEEVRSLRNAVAHARALPEEKEIWRWMRSTHHLARDLSA
jgi:hypothetical protein